MKKILSTTLIALMVMLSSIMQAKVTHLLPKPHSVKTSEGAAFALGRKVTITDETGCVALQKFFTDNKCTIGDDGATVNVTIVESIAGAHDYTLEGFDNEAYTLTVTADAIEITAVKPVGVIRAAQTLAQLAEGYEGTPAVEAVEIKDWAAFKLRGYMHDVGRSFIKVETLKKHIDLLSRFKVNCFHWHFTENQAWRFQVKAYPALTSESSMTRFAGKYYTQEECKEVAAYAKERGVIIIPEIDMPGHSEAFVRAMGFDMQTDKGVEVLKNVLTEVASVFADAPYIHIGADEKAITYTNFLGIITDHIHGLGKKVVVWNPISGVNVSNTNTDMTQMWSSSGNKIAGRPNIDCRYNYTNHFDVFADVVGIYRSNIYYVEEGNSEVAGTISAYWNDRKTPTEEDIVKQNNMYANVIASAERAWRGGGKQYIEKGGTMLPNSGDEYDEFADWERRFLFHKANSLAGEPIPYVKQTNIRWRITDAFPNNGDKGAIFPPETENELQESYTYNGNTYYTGIATGAGIYLRHTWGNNIIPTYYGSTNHSNSTAYAWTYVYSEKGGKVGANIEFQNYARSEDDAAPAAGTWDYKGSKIWINDAEIAPPTWTNAGKSITNEIDLGNENFTARKPIEVTLNAGWNKVFLKLPYVGVNAGTVRLNKWLFTCVFTDLETGEAADLIYSPNQCKDEATELVAAKVSEIIRGMGTYVGTQPGYWPASSASALNAKIEEIKATYSATKTAEERAAQIAELETAWSTFTASLNSENMNQPIASTDEAATYYRMCTPLRGNRYPTSKGADAAVVGETATTSAGVWKFVARTDGSFDIVNAKDNTFISPASNNNSALKTVATKPSAGWTIKPADAPGYVIIVSGSAQFNQTNNSTLGYQVYNWGSGTNTTDTGCKYVLIDVSDSYSPDDAVGEATTNAANINIYGLQKTFGLVQNAANYTCNFPASTSQESGNTTANMIDNVNTTFFHSGYDGTRGDGTAHYLQADLGKKVKEFRFYFNRRSQNNNNRPTSITISGSDDGSKFTAIKTVSSGFPTNANVNDYYSEKVVCNGDYRYIRFTINHTNTDTSSSNPFFTFSEFYILPCNNKVNETFDAVNEWRAATNKTNALATALNKAYDFNNALTNGVPADSGEYLLYSDTYYNGEYVNRYLYNNNGTLALSTEPDESNDAYLWVATETSAGQFTFANKAGKYLAHKAMGNDAYNFTVSTERKSHAGVTLYSIGASRYFVVKNNGGSFDQSTSTYNQTSGDWCTDFVFVPTNLYEGYKSLAVVSNAPLAGGVFTWNDQEIGNTPIYVNDGESANDATLSLKECDPAYKFVGFYSDANYTNLLGTTHEISEITANTTIYAKFALDIFSTSLENAVPVQIYNNRSNAYDIRVNAAADYNDHAVNSGASTYGESEVWYLVGNESSFKLYSHVAGETLAVKLAGTGSGSAATMTTAANATALCLTQQADGSYGICPVGATGQSFNMHGGNGHDIKLYATSDAGSTWCFKKLYSKPLNIKYTTSFDGGYENNTRIGSLAININGAISNINLTQSTVLDAQELYLPVGATYSMAAGTLYRGWKIEFNGEQAIPEQIVPADGADIEVTVAVDEENKYQYIYYSNDANGKPYRIPAIATAPNGTVFAISDNRPCGSDIGYGEVDIKCRISNDNGETWGEEFFIANGTGGNSNVMTTGYGDAAIVADREQNKLLVMMVCGRTVCWNGRWHPDSTTTSPNINRVARVYATYNEQSNEWEWSEPEEVTNSIYSLFLKNGVPTVSSMFIGSGRIAQSKKVKVNDYYRIYCSIWTRDNGNRVIYSDDFGGSWNILGTVDDRPAPNGDEPKVEELADGTIVLSSRKSSGRYFNIYKFTNLETAAGSWSSVASSNDVSNGLSYGANSTNGEIMRVKAVRKSDNAVCDVMLQSVPCGNGRRDVGIFYKEMVYGANEANVYTPTTFSQGWTKGLAVTDKESAYSTMTLQKDNRIGFFFEEVPNGYCMVYVPLTLEEITNDKYSVYVDPSTGVDAVIATPTYENASIYDISGRVIDEITESGIYIMGSKKVIIKK